MVNRTYNQTIVDYLNDLSTIPFAAKPLQSNGNEDNFAKEREIRNIEFGFIIQKYLSHERELLKEIKDLEQKTRLEASLEIPKDYARKEQVREYQKRLRSSRVRLAYHRRKHKPEYVQAKQGLSQSGLFLVVNIAKRIGRKYKIKNMVDLIGDGNGGLMHATDKFDPKKGCQFSTYATYWIKQAIFKGLYGETKRHLSISIDLCQKKGKVNRIEDILTTELEREPTEEETAERYNQVHASKDPKKRINPKDIRCLRQLKKVSRLVITVGNEERNLDIKDNDVGMSSETANQDEKMEKVLDYLANSECFTPNERETLKYRFGLADGTRKTLKETGQILRITRERVRQIQAKAINKLRLHLNPEYGAKFKKKE